MLNFSLPLLVVARKWSLLDEPMPVLVVNLAFTDLLFGICAVLIGVVDLVFVQSVFLEPCLFLQYTSASLAVGMKVAHLALAIDQFIAVVFPLRYYDIITDKVKKLVMLTWATLLLNVLFGAIAFLLGLETVVEFDLRILNVTKVATHCRWELMSNAFVISLEVQAVMLSACAGALFVYTGMKGVCHLRRIRAGRIADNSGLTERFRIFQRIFKVVSLLIVLDIIAFLTKPPLLGNQRS
ncbi:olfactory receptor 52N4-like [Pollicipes pollicipes]|uniref:olfactory receptor 52N4-like n=1 Tax=Pollicipes pollicipes TaxID=41117 RepID=UPI0018853194|nr:olfactory receptor 52N4-like [Pollicipes pollicipes]